LEEKMNKTYFRTGLLAFVLLISLGLFASANAQGKGKGGGHGKGGNGNGQGNTNKGQGQNNGVRDGGHGVGNGKGQGKGQGSWRRDLKGENSEVKSGKRKTHKPRKSSTNGKNTHIGQQSTDKGKGKGKH
jgi:hypothetical protein